MAFLHRQRWVRQPGVGQLPPIDYSKGIARALVGAWMPTPAGMIDLSPYRNHALTPSGTRPPIEAGPNGGMASIFPATGYYWRAGSSTPPQGGVSGFGISIAMWVRMQSSPTAYGQILTRDAGTSGGYDWGIFHNVSARQLAWGYNGGYIGTANATVAAGEWHFWHYSQDAANSSLWFLDGQPAGTTQNNNIGRPGNGAIRFNERSDSASGNSDVGRVYLWTRGLSAQEMRQVYLDEWGLLAPRTIALGAASGGDQTITLTDSGAGSDSITIGAALALTDSGAGTDALSIAAALALADSGTGTDGTPSITVTVTLTDAGTGLETFAGSASIALTDSGAGSDALSILTATLVSIADSATGSDAVAITVSLGLTDTGAGADGIGLTTDTLKAIADVASGSDNVSITVQVAVPDSGTGAELLGITAALAVLDVGVGYDVAIVSAPGLAKIVEIRFAVRTRRVTFALRTRSIEFAARSRTINFTMH